MNTMLKSSLKRSIELISGLSQLMLDICFPPHCPSCDEPVDAEGNMCAMCFSQLQHIAPPHCDCCGMPFAVHIADDNADDNTATFCAACLSQPRTYDSARAVWVYNHISSQLITRLKFGDHATSLPRYAKLMAQRTTPAMRMTDVIIPVPLHWRRLMLRRYNQSALLAYCLAKELQQPVLANCLVRVRATIPQTRLKGPARVQNVKNAFAVKSTDIAHKHILLIDDVMTTGATINACTKALKSAGAASVHVLTLARTVRE